MWDTGWCELTVKSTTAISVATPFIQQSNDQIRYCLSSIQSKDRGLVLKIIFLVKRNYVALNYVTIFEETSCAVERYELGFLKVHARFSKEGWFCPFASWLFPSHVIVRRTLQEQPQHRGIMLGCRSTGLANNEPGSGILLIPKYN